MSTLFTSSTALLVVQDKRSRSCIHCCVRPHSRSNRVQSSIPHTVKCVFVPGLEMQWCSEVMMVLCFGWSTAEYAWMAMEGVEEDERWINLFLWCATCLFCAGVQCKYSLSVVLHFISHGFLVLAFLFCFAFVVVFWLWDLTTTNH